MILDFGNTPAQHAQCHTTPAARFLEISDVSGLFAVFFFCNQDLWSWIVAKLHHSMPSVIIHLLHNFKFSTFLGQQVQLQPPEVIVIFGCFSSWRNLHRSHFGSRYTLGCCGHAGLSLWGSIPPASPNLCLLPRDDGTSLAC